MQRNKRLPLYISLGIGALAAVARTVSYFCFGESSGPLYDLALLIFLILFAAVPAVSFKLFKKSSVYGDTEIGGSGLFVCACGGFFCIFTGLFFIFFSATGRPVTDGSTQLLDLLAAVFLISTGAWFFITALPRFAKVREKSSYPLLYLAPIGYGVLRVLPLFLAYAASPVDFTQRTMVAQGVAVCMYFIYEERLLRRSCPLRAFVTASGICGGVILACALPSLVISMSSGRVFNPGEPIAFLADLAVCAYIFFRMDHVLKNSKGEQSEDR